MHSMPCKSATRWGALHCPSVSIAPLFKTIAKTNESRTILELSRTLIHTPYIRPNAAPASCHSNFLGSCKAKEPSKPAQEASAMVFGIFISIWCFHGFVLSVMGNYSTRLKGTLKWQTRRRYSQKRIQGKHETGSLRKPEMRRFIHMKET